MYDFYLTQSALSLCKGKQTLWFVRNNTRNFKFRFTEKRILSIVLKVETCTTSMYDQCRKSSTSISNLTIPHRCTLSTNNKTANCQTRAMGMSKIRVYPFKEVYTFFRLSVYYYFVIVAAVLCLAFIFSSAY